MVRLRNFWIGWLAIDCELPLYSFPFRGRLFCALPLLIPKQETCTGQHAKQEFRAKAEHAHRSQYPNAERPKDYRAEKTSEGEWLIFIAERPHGYFMRYFPPRVNDAFVHNCTASHSPRLRRRRRLYRAWSNVTGNFADR